MPTLFVTGYFTTNTKSNWILTVQYRGALPRGVTSGFTELNSGKVGMQSVPRRSDVVSRRRVAERLAAARTPPSGDDVASGHDQLRRSVPLTSRYHCGLLFL